MSLTQTLIFTAGTLLVCVPLIVIAIWAYRNLLEKGEAHLIHLIPLVGTIACPVFTLTLVWMSVTNG